jgi:hypothetical protein
MDVTTEYAYNKRQAWDKIKRENPEWFSPESVEFWGTQCLFDAIHPVGAENYLFITSEDNFDRTKKLYSVREAFNGGGIHTHAFQEFSGIETAWIYLAALVYEEQTASGIEQRW